MNSEQIKQLKPGRYFFALIPDISSRMQIQHIMKRLPADQPLKLQTTDNLHQTLVFLGELNQMQISALLDQVSQIRSSPLQMQFDHLSYWSQPNIFCLTSRAPDESLYRLVNQLQSMAQAAGIEIDTRPYQPHITLARKANKSFPVPIAPVRFKSEEVVLMRSVSTDQGPQYQVVMQWLMTAD